VFSAEDIDEPRWAGIREVIGMSWPIILGSLSHTVLEFCDKWMVSTLGTEELAAAGSAGIWSFTLSTMLLGIVGCVSTFAGQSLGRGEKQHCARYAWQGIWLSFGAVFLILALWPLAGPFFGIMGHSEKVTTLELQYFRLRLPGYIAMAWGTALAAFFQAVDRPRIPMYTAILGTAVNLFLNYLLIFGNWGFPRLEIAGAALATVIAQFIQVLALHLVFISRPFNREFRTRSAWRWDPVRSRELVRIGIYSGLSMLMDVANWGIFTSFVVGSFGAIQLASHNIALSFMHVSFMPAVALNQGIAAIVSRWIGRGDIPRAKARTYTAIKLAASYMLFMGAFFALTGNRLIFLTFSQEPEVIRTGHKLLILAAVFQGFDAVNIICMGALRGAGDTRWIMWIMFISAYVFFLPLAVLIAVGLNGQVFGAWFSATLFITALSVFFFRRFQGEKWRSIRIFKADLEKEA
jgi:multidrug resistance protein, MATE family